MTDQLRELLSDAVGDVEPGYALDDIRARTTRSRRRWPYAAGGAALAIAASVTAFAVIGQDNTPTATDPGSTPSPSATTSATSIRPSEVYYVGDTPDGPRLYLERRMIQGDPFAAALDALTQTPLDPDYRTYWPAGSFAGADFAPSDNAVVQVSLADASLHDRPATMDPATAQMAIEQVVHTLHELVSSRVAVQFILDGNPIDQVLGVPTSEPLASGPVLDTLAHVSLNTPTEGLIVDNDSPLGVDGVGNSFEGNIVTRLQSTDGRDVIDPQPTIAGTYEDRLFPFNVTLDLSDVPPGDYVVLSQTDDPSGLGRFHTDTRNITVVD